MEPLCVGGRGESCERYQCCWLSAFNSKLLSSHTQVEGQTGEIVDGMGMYCRYECMMDKVEGASSCMVIISLEITIWDQMR